MFLHVSVILFTGGSAPLYAEIHPPSGPEAGTPLPPDQRQAQRPPPRDQAAPQEQTPLTPRADTTPTTPAGADTPSACWEIWATSGRYASYWNAILFSICTCDGYRDL